MYDEIGSVNYRHMHLGKYKDEVKLEPPKPITVKNPVKVMEFSEIINAPAESVYQVMIDLPARTKWVEGVKAVELRDANPNHLGTVHKCVQEGDDSWMMTTAVKADKNLMEFWETDTKGMVSCKLLCRKNLSSILTSTV